MVLALGVTMTNVAARHPELGDGFRDEIEEEFRRTARMWMADHPEPVHSRGG